MKEGIEKEWWEKELRSTDKRRNREGLIREEMKKDWWEKE